MRRCFLIPKIDFEVEWLRQNLHPGDCILPLGLSPFAQLKNLLPDVHSVDDWIPYAEIRRLASRAYEVNQVFAAESCRGAVFEGYDWPRICSYMQDYFFRDVLLAEVLSLRLKADFENIIWVGNASQEPCLMLPTANVFASTLSFYLGNHFEVLNPPGQMAQAMTRVYLKIRNGARLFRKKVVFGKRVSLPGCHIAAIFPPTEEWERFSEALADLHREFGEQFQLWSLGRVSRRMREWTKKEGIQVVWVPYPDKVGNEVASFFGEHWKHWLSEGRRRFAVKVNCPVLASRNLQYHFEFYFLSIWPRTAAYARVLERYLKRAEARWLIGSTNPTVSYLFPYEVARKLGIQSIALPHGYVQVDDCRIYSSFLACRNKFERGHFRRAFPADTQILYCRNAANELSYLPRKEKQFYTDQKKRVLILTCDPDIPEALMSTVDRRAFINSFTQLVDYPDDLADFEFLIKSHPRFNLSTLFLSLGIRSDHVTILDADVSLLDLLEKAWAVAMFNYFGSAAVLAIRAEKPILFLNSAGLFLPPGEEWLAFPAGEVVEDIPSFWSLLRRLKGSPAFYRELQGRCQRFKAEQLEIVEQTLPQRVRESEGRQAFPRAKETSQPTLPLRRTLISEPTRVIPD